MLIAIDTSSDYDSKLGSEKIILRRSFPYVLSVLETLKLLNRANSSTLAVVTTPNSSFIDSQDSINRQQIVPLWHAAGIRIVSSQKPKSGTGKKASGC